MEEFIQKNTKEINQKRTELMIKSKSEVLDIIIGERSQLNKNNMITGNFGHSDSLPFSEIVPDIVESLDNHPEKPVCSFISLKRERIKDLDDVSDTRTDTQRTDITEFVSKFFRQTD